MNAPISNPADCEVRGVIRFLEAENVRPSEIQRRLVAVNGEHVMKAASVRKWCTMFTNGRTDLHDADRSGVVSLSTQTHWSKRWNASFERMDVSQLAKGTKNVQKCLVQLCKKLSPNICNTAKFVHVGYRGSRGGFLVRTRKEKVNWCHGTTSASMSNATMWRSRWRCVIKPAYTLSFLLSINIFVWQNVPYFLNVFLIYTHKIGSTITPASLTRFDYVYIYNICFYVLWISPIRGLEWPRGFQEVKFPRFHDNSTGWWWGYQPYPPAAFTHSNCSWYSFLLEAESTPGP